MENINYAAGSSCSNLKPDPIVFSGDLAKAHGVGQKGSCTCMIRLCDSDAIEASYGVLRRNRPFIPCIDLFRVLVGDELQLQAVRIRKGEDAFIETLVWSVEFDSMNAWEGG